MSDRTNELKRLIESFTKATGLLLKEIHELNKTLKLNTKAINEQNILEKRGRMLSEVGFDDDIEESDDDSNDSDDDDDEEE